MKPELRQELIDLGNAHLEGRLGTAERERLESLLQRDAEARRLFVDFMHDHAVLHWDSVGADTRSSGYADFTAEASPRQAPASPIPFPSDQRGTMGHDASRPSPLAPLWRAAAALAMLAILGLGWHLAQADTPTFAVMEKTSAARWESGSLPTSQGARLGAGTLRLAEGLAIMRFDSGAEVVLEAPAELEVIDAMHCLLRSGTVVADIPDSALGFEVTTPSAQVVDYGTRFVVNVDRKTGGTQTQVFDGLVEVAHPESGEVVRLETGQRTYVAGDEVGEVTSGVNEGDWTSVPELMPRGPDWELLPTARDAYVHRVPIKSHASDTLLLVKASDFEDGPSRKAYLGFDLSALNLDALEEAELILHFTPTGWGLAAIVPDATFTIWGLRGAALDDWPEVGLTWQNAPGSLPEDGLAMDTTKAVPLGQFVMEQGVQRGRFGIEGDALRDFLADQKADGFATLVVIRDTREEEKAGLVHGFASRRHPELPAPTLALRFSN